MRHLRLILALSVAVSAASPAPLLARQSSGVTSDAVTCMGAYGALGKLRDNLAVASPDLKAIPNFTAIDFSARKAELQRRTSVDAAQASAAESTAISLLTSGVLNNSPDQVQRVLDTVARCDAVFAFRPQLGQVQTGGPSVAAPSAPEPAPAPTPAPLPVAPTAPPASTVSTMDDRGCAIAYLALSWGNSANPTLAASLLERAKTSGSKYMAANPKLTIPDVQSDIQTAAKARLDPIVAGGSPDSLFADVRSCDAKYGYGLPDGVKP